MKPELSHIVFEVTTDCNLNCHYCYNIWKRPNADRLRYNSYKQARKTLKKLFSVAETKNITMSGGEPFLAERFSELVLYCRMKGKNVTIITNGNMGSKKEYDLLHNLGVNLFEIPLHSVDKSIHDKMTQISGSWKKSVRSIKEIISLGAKVAGVIVITKYNIKHIKESVLQLADLRVNYIMINRFNVGGRGIEKFDNLQLDKPQLNRAFAEANEVGRSLSIPITSNVCTPLCLVNPENYPHIKFAACSPDIDRKPLTLDILGNLRICNHSPVIMGNIYKEKLSDILSSDYALSWYTVPDYCSECKIFDKCYGGCRGASEQIGRSLRDVDPVLTDLPNDERRALSNL